MREVSTMAPLIMHTKQNVHGAVPVGIGRQLGFQPTCPSILAGQIRIIFCDAPAALKLLELPATSWREPLAPPLVLPPLVPSGRMADACVHHSITTPAQYATVPITPSHVPEQVSCPLCPFHGRLGVE